MLPNTIDRFEPQFNVIPVRLTLLAHEPIYFPPSKATNVLRGGFGASFRDIACTPSCDSPAFCSLRDQCPYALIFEPTLLEGPSGLADSPRPFVFRSQHLDGVRILPKQHFHFDLHLC
jgi:hypothetical protein